MTKDFLEGEYVPAIHNEMTGEGVPADMCKLASGQIDPGPFDRFPKSSAATDERHFFY